MSATVIRVTPEITGANAPETPTGKPPAEKAQPVNQNNTPPPTTENPERPKWLPEKFKSAEDLAAAYAELEKKQSTPPAEGQQQKPVKGEQKPTPDAAKDAAFKPYFDEFETNGKLSDESYAALEKQGLSRAMVDAYARGVQAQRDEGVTKVYDSVGGQESYAQITAWASQNLNEAERNAYNKTLDTGSPEQIALAAQGLKVRYEAANGRKAQLVHGNANGTTTVPFRSTAELVQAMSDPRYKTDEAYRGEVEARLSGSSVL